MSICALLFATKLLNQQQHGACQNCYMKVWRTALAGFQWDYVFDWTILKYQQTKNHAAARPDAAPAAQADPADTDKGDRSGFARASRGDSGRRSVLVAWVHGCLSESAQIKMHKLSCIYVKVVTMFVNAQPLLV